MISKNINTRGEYFTDQYQNNYIVRLEFPKYELRRSVEIDVYFKKYSSKNEQRRIRENYLSKNECILVKIF